MINNFDKTDVFDAQIQEKVDEVLRLCNRERIPMFFCAAVKNSEEGTEYRKEMFASASNGIKLTNDYLPDFVNVTNGFSTTPPFEMLEIPID
jgi:hypothetical protein